MVVGLKKQVLKWDSRNTPGTLRTCPQQLFLKTISSWFYSSEFKNTHAKLPSIQELESQFKKTSGTGNAPALKCHTSMTLLASSQNSQKRIERWSWGQPPKFTSVHIIVDMVSHSDPSCNEFW